MKNLYLNLILVATFSVYASGSGNNPLQVSLLSPINLDTQNEQINKLLGAVQNAESYQNFSAKKTSMTRSQAVLEIDLIKTHRNAIQQAILPLITGQSKIEKIFTDNNNDFDKWAPSKTGEDQALLMMSCFCCCTYSCSSWYPGKGLFDELKVPIAMGKSAYQATAHLPFPEFSPQQRLLQRSVQQPVIAHLIDDRN